MPLWPAYVRCKQLCAHRRCSKCGHLIGKGVRFNAEKKAIGAYFSTKIWAFTMRAPCCQNRIEIHTDPKNARYIIVEGAREKVCAFAASRLGLRSPACHTPHVLAPLLDGVSGSVLMRLHAAGALLSWYMSLIAIYQDLHYTKRLPRLLMALHTAQPLRRLPVPCRINTTCMYINLRACPVCEQCCTARQAETWTAADAETMELETAAERSAIRDDPLARLEHGLDDKRRAKETRGRLLELRADAEAKYADDYAINKALRGKNRCAVWVESLSRRACVATGLEATGRQLHANPAPLATAHAEAAQTAALRCQQRGPDLLCINNAASVKVAAR